MKHSKIPTGQARPDGIAFERIDQTGSSFGQLQLWIISASTEGNPEHRISSILRDQSLDPLSAPVILPRMESLYIGALESAYPNSSTADTLHLFHDVVGAISTAKRALSPNELQCLLSFSSQIPFRVEDIDGVTSRLCSVMAMDCRIPEKLYTIHPSFALFLVSSQ